MEVKEMRWIMITLGMLLAIPSFATAQEFEWKGLQVMTLVGGSVSLSETVTVGGTAIDFWIPRDDVRIFFGYIGPSFNVTPNFWVSPQIGAASQFVDGEDSFILAINIGVSIGQVDFFAGTNWIVSPDQKDLFNAYSIDWTGLSDINFGFYSEQINNLFTIAPRIGIDVDTWHGEIQCHLGFQNENYGYNVRFVNSFLF